MEIHGSHLYSGMEYCFTIIDVGLGSPFGFVNRCRFGFQGNIFHHISYLDICIWCLRDGRILAGKEKGQFSNY
jgi:hypothetical protein